MNQRRSDLNQAKMMHEYNDTHREKFNEEIFTRRDEDIIDELEKVILSCERNTIFTLKVISFTVIDNYDTILEVLHKHEQTKGRYLKESSKNEFKESDSIFTYEGRPEDINVVRSVINIDNLNTINQKYRISVFKPFHIRIVDNLTYCTNYTESTQYTIEILSPSRFKNIEMYISYLNGELLNIISSCIESKKRNNKYDFINLKDSDIKLLAIKYLIQVKDRAEILDVFIAVPRIVNKYYFRISGNIYSAMYQIVDGSTYNNSTSNSKKHNITLKCMFMPIRLNRILTSIQSTKGEDIKTISYISRVFNKSLAVMKYILAKYGLYEGMKYMKIPDISITKYDIDDEYYYTFQKNDNIFINVPKVLFDGDHVVQSLIITIYKSITKNTTYEELFQNEFWLKSLGGEFNNYSVEKGLSVLDSLEGLYDIKIKEDLRLKPERKKNIYDILMWMFREFSNLKIKDNLDISTKKIRCAEYIASLYAMKISKGIYRILDKKGVQIESIRKAVYSDPMYLLGAISKCKLINYNNAVNDMDALVVLKCTYKGPSGLGEQNGTSIPLIYRSVHQSHLGRTDLDASSANDPGLSGSLCPLVKLYDSSFSDYQEPDFWEDEFAELTKTYKALVGRQEVINFNKKVFNDVDIEEEQIVNDSVNTFRKLISPITFVENSSQLNDNNIEYEFTVNEALIP